MLMAIPRNLVYILVCSIFGAFLGMIYIVYFDIDINKFTIQYSFQKVDVKVHALYKHLQQVTPALPANVTLVKDIDLQTFHS